MSTIIQEPQNPLILRCHRIMDAYAKSNDERDFFLNRTEGYLIYVDLDKSQEELDLLEKEINESKDEFVMVPKLTFYETKKIMEGFIAEKVYDIDTKEKLLDIIQSKEARENFLEFISDHHAEFEKWQQYYQERSRIRIIEWLRLSHFHFVFEEDLDLDGEIIDKLKRNIFETKVGKDLISARKGLALKAKTYYSTEALNPRPKRGRPPKQAMKIEVETQASVDIYLTISPAIRPFLFVPDISSASSVNFSAKFDEELDLLVPRRLSLEEIDTETALQNKMAALRSLSARWIDNEPFDDEDSESELESEFNEEVVKPKSKSSPVAKKPVVKEAKVTKGIKETKTVKSGKSAVKGKNESKKTDKKGKTTSKASLKIASKTKTPPHKTTKKIETKTSKKPALRSIVKTKK